MIIVCIGIYLTLYAIGFILELYWDVNGRPKREPMGFAGVMATLAILALSVAMNWKIGIWDLMFR
jgi:hypothetical protein